MESKQAYRDAQLEQDLLRQAVDDKAFSRLLKAKRDLPASAADWERIEKIVGEEGVNHYRYYGRLLKDIPRGADCQCCGKKSLVNVHRRDGKVVGSECRKSTHAMPCKGPASDPAYRLGAKWTPDGKYAKRGVAD